MSLRIRRRHSFNPTRQNPLRQLCESVVRHYLHIPAENTMGEPDRLRTERVGMQKHSSGQYRMIGDKKPINPQNISHNPVTETPGKPENSVQIGDVLNEIKKLQSTSNKSKLDTINETKHCDFDRLTECKLYKKANSDSVVEKIKKNKVSDKRLATNQNQIVIENCDSIANLKEDLRAEHLRRVQCENLIHSLQKMILELHGKVTMAIDVDKAKDQEILKYHESWQKASSEISKLIDENKQLQTNLDKSNKSVEKTKKKCQQYKREAAEAMSMYKIIAERVAELDSIIVEVSNRLQNKEEKLLDLGYRYIEEVERNKKLGEVATK